MAPTTHPTSSFSPSEFRICAANVAGLADPAPAVAAARSGVTGILNLEFLSEREECERAIAAAFKAVHGASGALGLQLDPEAPFAQELMRTAASYASFIVLSFRNVSHAQALAGTLAGVPLIGQVTSEAQAAAAVHAGCAGLIAKGHEAGGFVGEESTFVLLQRLVAKFDLPVWAHGGVGLHSAPACIAAGASGLVIDNQLLLAPECRIPAALRSIVERFEGDETTCIGREVGHPFRAYSRPDAIVVAELDALETHAPDRWLNEVARRSGWRSTETNVMPLGQDAAFAAPLAKAYGSIAGIIRGIEQSVAMSLSQAREQNSLGPASPLAASHGTEFPILQGPMTRVSDTAEFASEVAKAGGLPFLALALLRAPECRTLLEKTRDQLADRPWGVGILGFVQPELRLEQLAVVMEIRPRFALIAGGRPDQAKQLEQIGIATYLHVPAPGLLRLFLADGARRFVFEGRECGGHVGPRTSLVLWDTMVRVLLEACDTGTPPEELHVVFAGGIHDDRSAAAVAALAAPLAARGARIGVLMGTAYLFTNEAVSGGAIVEGFQREAIECADTVVLESGPGHATRCVDTEFAETFRQHRRELLAQGKPAEEVRNALEDLNVGRLRVASKGLTRSGSSLVPVTTDDQRKDGMYMIGQVAALRNRLCAARELHQHVSQGSVDLLANLDVPSFAARQTPRWAEKPCDVAIVGMSCILPKAENLHAFWRNTLQKVDAIVPVPEERFDTNVFFDTDKKVQDKFYSRVGGFIGDVAFDPIRYGIPPNTLHSIDTSQLLMLIAVDEALADAGYRQRHFDRGRASVIFGFSGGLGELGINYALRATLPKFAQTPPEMFERLPLWTEDSFAGILPNVGSGRIANRFDFSGVNFTVDAACASSLAAIYIAARELVSGDSDMVVSGGIDTGQNPFGYLCFATAQALSPGGRCRPFDAGADGIAISEGISVVVLKRLADAERDGDRIYAVLKGIAGSSDGRGRSMTAPRREGQMLALRRAYQHAHIDPKTVGLIEAHGTGTVAGDAAELKALDEVFRSAGAATRTCAIGSVKSMIGHTKAAAGVTGLVKTTLALYHRVLPPTLHVERPNPELRDPGTPFFVATDALPWTSANLPRRAGVSSFGFGGTNFHAVLEEYSGSASPKSLTNEWPVELSVIRAASPEALTTAIKSALTLCEDKSEPLRKVAAAICSRWGSRGTSNARLAVVASSVSELETRLAGALNAIASGRLELRDEPAGVYLSTSAAAGKVAFLFPGQGSQYPGMLRELALRFPEFGETLELADAVLKTAVSSRIYPPSAFSEDEEKAQMAAITDTSVAQPALGVVDVATARLLKRFGIIPDMTAGHSYGEYVALCAAGVISTSDTLRASEERGLAIKAGLQGESGTMAAVSADGAAVAKLIADLPGVTIANLNAPRQTVIGGAVAAIDAATKAIEAAGVAVRRIPVACAFHTELMAPACQRLATFLSQIEFRSPQIPVFSNVKGLAHSSDPKEIAGTLSEHLVRPVRWTESVQAMYGAGARVFVEAGPKGVLTNLGRQILDGTDAIFIQLDASNRSGLPGLLHGLAQIYASGVNINADELFAGRLDQSAEPSTATWYVNPARVFRAGDNAIPVERLVLHNGTSQRAAEWQIAPSAAPIAPSPAPASAAFDPGAESVVMQYQSLMTQFLQTQTAVMTAYLTGGPAVTTTATTAPAALPPAPVPVVSHQAPAPVQTPAIEVHVEAVQTTAASELLQLVSERTGYPIDMLIPDASLEADLGIDSIKRVEIIGAYIRTRSENEQAAIRVQMDKLTGARTLNAIIEVLTSFRSDQAAPAAPAVAIPAQRDLMKDLLQLVSERTGYPIDMLDVNASLEADLGIDSIKRVEFLGAFRRSFDEAEAASIASVMEKLTRAKTLAEIGQLAEAALRGPEPAPVPAAPNRTSCFRLTPSELPAARAKAAAYPGRVVVITDDETGLAEGMAARFHARGEKPVLLRHSTAPVASSDVICADLTDIDAIDGALDHVRKTHGPVGAVIHLLPLRGDGSWRELDVAGWRHAIALDVRTAYAIARAAQPDLTTLGQSNGALFAAVTARGGAFGLAAANDIAPTHNSVADFVKTLALEFADIRCKIVDLDAGDPAAALLEKLAEELESDDNILQVGRPGDRRLTVVPQFVPPAAPSLTPALSANSVIVLTGGARGITAEIARSIAVKHKPALILAGMSPLPGPEQPAEIAGVTETAAGKAILLRYLRAQGGTVRPVDVDNAWSRLAKDREILRNIAAMRDAGARVEYVPLDVQDSAQLASLLDRVKAQYGRIDAVIHGAGAIEDKLIRDKTPESFARVVHTKAVSGFVLAQKLRSGEIGRLILMSSVTAALGNRGQADYAAANGILNGLALSLAGQQLPVVSFNWGPWDQTGMVSAAVREQFLSRGVYLIPIDDGVELVIQALDGVLFPAPIIVVGDGPWSQAALSPEGVAPRAWAAASAT